MFAGPDLDPRHKSGELTLPSGDVVFDRAWLPAHPEKAEEVVLCLHGVESHGAWFHEVAEALAGRGYVVHAYDRAGWGRSPGKRGHLPGYDVALRHLEELVMVLRERYARVHLAGLSWGGMLALYAMLRRGLYFDSLTLIAPGVIAKADLPFWHKLRVAGAILRHRDERRVPVPIHTVDFTKREDITRAIEADPHRTTQVSARFCFETLKMRAFCREQVPHRKLPRWSLLLAEHDAIVDNDAMRTLFRTQDVSVKQYAGKVHSLVFEDPARVAADIAERAEARMANADRKRVAVVGAGAVGSLVGGLLALRGHEVTLVGRAAHVEAIRKHGLRISLGAGHRVVRDHLDAVTTPEEADGPVDLVILAVKGFDTRATLAQLPPLLGETTGILSLQNGLGNEAILAEAYPGRVLLGGAICAYLDFPEPGHIVWSDDRGGLAGGVVQGEAEAARALWTSILPDTGMETRWVEASASVKWSKLILNVAFNALNAMTGLPTAEILAHKTHGTLAARALKEAFAVMRACGVEPVDLPGYPVTRMARLCRLPVGVVRRALAKVTAGQTKTVSSMQQDLRKGRGTTEIDDINGRIVREGAAHGIRTPANETLCRMMEERMRADAPTPPASPA